MALDAQLLEGLLYEAEGTSLDFKSAQYPFEQATDIEKSELLKDILAFANSWRRDTAYILIGVEECKGGRSNVVGVAEHLDDAKIHQFVNGKTQRPVEFSYQVIPIDGTTIGAIEIPLQERPTYLKKQYGKLREHEVPIRDGSSTRAATPNEIAKMGADEITGGTPLLSLQWANLTEHTVLSSPHTIRSVILEPQFHPETFTRPRHHLLGADLLSNPDYSREVIAYSAKRALLTTLGFQLENRSGVVGLGTIAQDHVIPPTDPRFAQQFAAPDYDTDLARSLLEQAGYPDGIDITLHTADVHPGMIEMAVAFQESAAPAGIRVAVKRHPPDAFWGEVWFHEPLTIILFSAKPTPDRALTQSYHSSSAYNATRYSTDMIDELIERARGETLEEQKVTYAELQRVIIDAVPRLIPVFQPLLYGVRANVRGVAPHPLNMPFFQDGWLDD